MRSAKTKEKDAEKITAKIRNREKTISFWKEHSVDMSSFQFNREEANSR